MEKEYFQASQALMGEIGIIIEFYNGIKEYFPLNYGNNIVRLYIYCNII